MSSLLSSQQSFLANALYVSTQSNTKLRKIPILCGQKPEELKDSSIKSKSEKLAKLALVSLAAGLLTVGSVSDAMAAKSGGRIGGQAFRSPAPRSAPRINNNNSRTNIYVNPRVAPPLVGGYGYGYGYGWSPFSFFAPGPGVAVGVGGGFDSLALFLFLGAATAVVRNLGRSRRRDDDDDDDY